MEFTNQEPIKQVSIKDLTNLRDLNSDDITSVIIQKIEQHSKYNTIIRYKLLNMLQSKKMIINSENIRTFLLKLSIDIDSKDISSINVNKLIKDLR